MRLFEIDSSSFLKHMLDGRLLGKVLNGVHFVDQWLPHEPEPKSLTKTEYRVEIPINGALTIQGEMEFQNKFDVDIPYGFEGDLDKLEYTFIPSEWIFHEVVPIWDGHPHNLTPRVTPYNTPKNWYPKSDDMMAELNKFTKLLYDHFHKPMVIEWFRMYTR